MLSLSVMGAERENVLFRGSLQHDGLFALNDKQIGATTGQFPYQSNTYLNLMLQSEWVNAGMRIETMEVPLPGFDQGFKGSGIGNLFVQARWRWGKATIGDVYAQYGSGLILRLYEERNLGIDNSLRGAKLELNPYKGISLEAIAGKQRVYWNCYDKTAWNLDMTKGCVIGANMELQVDDWSERMQQKDMQLLIGASWVSKQQPQDTIFYSFSPPLIYNLPRWVGAADARVEFNYQGWNALVEYAWKANDPSADNLFSYRRGEALLLSLSYSRKGMSVIAQLRRSDNMSFRSDRLERGLAAPLNHLPALATTHTYMLAAHNSYATQLQGEWGFQGELRYSWKKHTPMGGRYGTTICLNASHLRGTVEGNWWKMSKEPYYTDVHLELQKKLAPQWYLNAMYMYQTYNQRVAEGHGSLVRSHILVADVKYSLSDKVQMRAELQYLYSRQDEGQWIYGLYELSLFSDFILSVSDMYNIGGTALATHNHYYMASFTLQKLSHRFMLSFGRTREGYNCTGGVCRYVPQQSGVNLSYNFSF